MALKHKVTAAAWNDLPEVVQAEYTKVGDNYELQVEGLEDRTKEFRANNIKLQKQLADATTAAERFKDIDPEKYAEALEAKKKLDAISDKSLLEEGKVEELFGKRTEAMRQEHEKVLKRERDQREKTAKDAEKYRNTVRTMKLEGMARDTISKLGSVRPGAMEDILNRARNTFQFDDDDNPVAPDKYDAESNPLTLDTWAKSLLTSSPYLFEPVQGGGAQGGRKGAPVTDPNGVKVLKNPSAKEFALHAEGIASGKIRVVDDPE